MNKKTLFLGGIVLVALGAFLYQKSKKATIKAVDSVGDGVANKVGDVTQSIIRKAMDESLANKNVTNKNVSDTKQNVDTNLSNQNASDTKSNTVIDTLLLKSEPEKQIFNDSIAVESASTSSVYTPANSSISNTLELEDSNLNPDSYTQTPVLNQNLVWEQAFVSELPKKASMSYQDSFGFY